MARATEPRASVRRCPGPVRRSLPLVLPVAALPLGQPIDGGGEAFLARGVGLRLGHPLHVLLAVAVAERVERGERLAVLPDRGHEVRRHRERAVRGRARLRRLPLAAIVDGDRGPDQPQQVAVGGEILPRRDPAELAHRLAAGFERDPRLACDRAGPPEAERDVLLERRHPAQDALVHEGGGTPLDRFLDVGAALVHVRAQVLEDRPGERGRLRDVRVDARILLSHRTASYRRSHARASASVSKISIVICGLSLSVWNMRATPRSTGVRTTIAERKVFGNTISRRCQANARTSAYPTLISMGPRVVVSRCGTGSRSLSMSSASRMI